MSGLSQLINRFSIIKNQPIFRRLNFFDLHAIASCCVLIELKKGDVIGSSPDDIDGFYCIVTGRIVAYAKTTPSRHIADYLHRGGYFGHVAILTDEPEPFVYEALNDSLLVKIPRSEFLRLTKNIPQLSIEISRSLSRRVKNREAGDYPILESTIISVYSPIRYAGSSTYAINLARYLAEETHKRVIFVHFDLDLAQDGDSTRRTKGRLIWKKLAPYLHEVMDARDALKNHIISGKWQTDLLHLTIEISKPQLIEKIGHFVSLLADDYHYVIVDLPNERHDAVLKVLCQSDMVHLITTDNENDLLRVKDVIAQLQETLPGGIDMDCFQIVLGATSSKSAPYLKQINRFIGFDIFGILPRIKEKEWEKSFISEEAEIYIPNHHSSYAKTIRYIAKRVGGTLVGLALGGGAALGLAHIGVLKVLEREGIQVDVVVGSSMGALIAALWATGMEARQIELVAKEFDRPRKLLKLYTPIFPRSGIIGSRRIRGWLKRKIENKDFYDTVIPLKIVSYDLRNRREIVRQEGPIVEAVMESIAIPGVFPPKKHGGQWIIDGGILNPLPTDVLMRLGIKKIIAVNVLPSPQDVEKAIKMREEEIKQKEKIRFFSNPRDFLSFRLSRFVEKAFFPNISDIIVKTLQATGYTIAEHSSLCADVIIHPDLSNIEWYELFRTEELMARGEEAVQEKIGKIKALIEERNSKP